MSDTYGSGFGASFTPETPGPPMDISPDAVNALPDNDGRSIVPAPERAGPTPLPGPEPEPTSQGPSFGQSLRKMIPGPHYDAPDPAASALDQSASLLEQRVKRANSIATNPIAQIFAPEQVAAARQFVPQAAEALQKIEQQKAAISSGRVQARTLGLDPGEVSDQATQEDRLTVASAKALKGDMRAFQGIQAVDPKRAEAIAPQVYETVAGHLEKAQFSFDSLSAMQNEGQYQAKLRQLRQDGTLAQLESLGMKVPATFEAFNASKAMEGRALREARIGINAIGQRLEERNTYQPMEKKEAETYSGRLTTAYGDQITNGTWARNGASGTRGLVVNGAADPNDLGKKFTLATPEQRKAIKEEFDGSLTKEDLEKYRAFNRTYELATKDAKGNAVPSDKINTNPNVQQGIAEGLASMLRGGSGGANVGLLKIELMKRGWAQTAIDGLVSNYAGTMNTLFTNADKPYLSAQTQKQIRDVMDVLKTYNDSNVTDRVSQVAQRAGALGLDPNALGLGKTEATGAIGTAMETGRREQINRMTQAHQAIGGGDGVLQLNAQRPGAGGTGLPAGSQRANELPGAQPLLTPVQQASTTVPATPAAAQPPATTPGGSSSVQPAPPGNTPPPGGAPSAPQPFTVAGQQVAMALPPGASPAFAQATQRIESGGKKDPWTATNGVTSASGAFQFIDRTWEENKPAGAPARAKDATPAQQAEAFANLTARNAATLKAGNLPVTDTSLYIAHNLGATGGSRLMNADPSADAREVVGEKAARNNPTFFKGRPTVATVLQRYADAIQQGAHGGPEGSPDEGPKKPKPSAGGATAEAPGFFSRVGTRVADAITGRLPGETAEQAYKRGSEESNRAIRAAGDAAIEHAPAIGGTVGAVAGGMAGNVPGGVAGGAAGSGAGQMLKDYLQGRPQSPTEIAKQTAIGGVLGVTSAARPAVAAAARVAGVGGAEAGAEIIKHGGEVTPEAVDEGLKGAGAALGGEMFGRALGMVGHKVYNLFAPDAKAAVRTAAKEYAEATATLEKEAPKIPGANGAAATVNPKYQAAEAVKAKSETVLKDAGLAPEEAAYAHKVSSEGVPKQEAEAGRPGAVEQQRVGQGYQQLEREVGDKGVGAVKATPRESPLPNGLKFAEGPSKGANADPRAHEIKVTDANGATQYRMEITQEANGMWGVGHVENVSRSYSGLAPQVYQQAAQYAADRGGRLVAGMNTNALSRRVLNDMEANGLATPIKVGGRTLMEIKPRDASYSPMLSDGPMSAVAGKQVSAKHSELAEHVERAITAPAKNWQEKWVQLKEARSDLLQAERDALSSTATGRTKTADDMRKLADTVRAQQAKAAEYVFGKVEGKAFMDRLNVLDIRYRRLMDATNSMDLAKAARMTGEAGREAEKRFIAFAHGDTQAIAAYRAMRGAKGDAFEGTVPWTVAGEGLPVVGKVIKVAKLGGMLREWAKERAAGNPVTFADLVKAPDNAKEWQSVRDILGSTGARLAVQ